MYIALFRAAGCAAPAPRAHVTGPPTPRRRCARAPRRAAPRARRACGRPTPPPRPRARPPRRQAAAPPARPPPPARRTRPPGRRPAWRAAAGQRAPSAERCHPGCCHRLCVCVLTGHGVTRRAKSSHCSTDCLAPKDIFGGWITWPRRRAHMQHEPQEPTGGQEVPGCMSGGAVGPPYPYLPITRRARADRRQAASCAHQAAGSSQGACSATLSSGAPPAAASSAASRAARSRNSSARAGAPHLSSHVRSRTFCSVPQLIGPAAQPCPCTESVCERADARPGPPLHNKGSHLFQMALSQDHDSGDAESARYCRLQPCQEVSDSSCRPT